MAVSGGYGRKLSLNLRLFLKARRMAVGAMLLVVLGMLNWLFAGVELPFISDGGDAYRAAVVYVTVPLIASLTALSMLPSRLSWWERRSRRRLHAQRAFAFCIVSIGAVLCTLCAVNRAALPQPVMLGLQGTLAGLGLGAVLLRVASFEVSTIVTSLYGLAGILMSTASEVASSLLLFGGSANSIRFLTALAVWLAGGLAFCLGSEPHDGG